MQRQTSALVLVLVVAMGAFAASGDGSWLQKVPAKDRERANPLATHPDAVPGGAKLYGRHCAQCHGEKGEGTKGRPDLHSDRVRNATPGELEWLIRNGSMKNGMPSWSSLPEPQRWQIVSYLKSLR